MSIQAYNPASLPPGNNFSIGRYRHVVLSISGTTHTLYLDGSMVAQNTNAGNIFASFPNFNKLYIGCQASSLSNSFTGNINDFRIYNRALLQSDVSNLYNRFKYNIPSNTVDLTKTTLSTVTTFNSITANDYGYILISTNAGIYYSTNYGTSFTLSNNTNACISVSMDNNGNALACTSTTIYSSTDFGQTWSAVTSQPSSVTGFKNVVKTLTGKSYVCTASTIFSSTDMFSSTPSAVTSGYTISGITSISCSSNDYIAVLYSNAGEFFNGSTWSLIGRSNTGSVPWILGLGISDNGQYIAANNNTGNQGVYYATITNGTIGSWTQVTYTNASGFTCVGNNGLIYTKGGVSNIAGYVHRVKNGAITNSIFMNSVFNISPNEKYAALVSTSPSKLLYIYNPPY